MTHPSTVPFAGSYSGARRQMSWKTYRQLFRGLAALADAQREREHQRVRALVERAQRRLIPRSDRADQGDPIAFRDALLAAIGVQQASERAIALIPFPEIARSPIHRRRFCRRHLGVSTP